MRGDDPDIALGAKVKHQQRFVVGKQRLGFRHGQRLWLGQGRIVGETLIENLLQRFPFRLDIRDALTDLLLCRRGASCWRLGDKRNHRFVQCIRLGSQVLILAHELCQFTAAGAKPDGELRDCACRCGGGRALDDFVARRKRLRRREGSVAPRQAARETRWSYSRYAATGFV